MTLITETDALAAFCQRQARARNSSPSTPNSCATRPIGRSSAWSRSPGPRRRRPSTRWRRASTSRRCCDADGRSQGAQGVPRRAPGHGDLLPPDGRHPGADRRHPGRGHGLRLRRCGELRDAGGQAGRGAHRQELALHRLGAAAADRAPARIRALRRHPSAPGLREAARAGSTRPGAPTGSPRRWRC